MVQTLLIDCTVCGSRIWQRLTWVLCFRVCYMGTIKALARVGVLFESLTGKGSSFKLVWLLEGFQFLKAWWPEASVSGWLLSRGYSEVFVTWASPIWQVLQVTVLFCFVWGKPVYRIPLDECADHVIPYRRKASNREVTLLFTVEVLSHYHLLFGNKSLGESTLKGRGLHGAWIPEGRGLWGPA